MHMMWLIQWLFVNDIVRFDMVSEAEKILTFYQTFRIVWVTAVSKIMLI